MFFIILNKFLSVPSLLSVFTMKGTGFSKCQLMFETALTYLIKNKRGAKAIRIPSCQTSVSDFFNGQKITETSLNNWNNWEYVSFICLYSTFF